MAKVEKYRIDFKTLQGDDARVSFLYEGYSGSVIDLTPGPRPFVLGEYNTDEDLYKPIRAMRADIEIITNSSGVTIDNFLADNDTDIQVVFYYFGVYWRGYLLQNDFQEIFDNQNHLLKLTASDGFGMMKNIEFGYQGTEIESNLPVLNAIQYCTLDVLNYWVRYFIFSDMYHTSMSTSEPNLAQCYINPKTFETSPGNYDNSYNVLEKINRSFNQTIFFYRDRFYIMRIEDLYRPSSESLSGWSVYSLGFPSPYTGLVTRYDINIGKTQNVKPISPQMLRFIRRMDKVDRVVFKYSRFSELIPNQSFQRGSINAVYPNFTEYLIDNWTQHTGDMFVKPVVSTPTITRREIYGSSTEPLSDKYIVIPQNPFSVSQNERMLASTPIFLYTGEKLKISIDHKFSIDFTTSHTLTTMFVRLDVNAPSTPPPPYIGYLLDNSGKWVKYFGTATENTAVEVDFNGSNGVKATEWNTNTIETEAMPESGWLTIWLDCPPTPNISGQERYFKGFEFEIINRFDGYQKGLVGIESRFTKDVDIKLQNDYEIYLDDSFSDAYRGAIYESDSTTLTDNTWYRGRFPSERVGFRKQNAISYWSHNRFNRTKIDANFYGLTSSTGVPIGIINTIKFVDDDPNKIYAITNLKEIDFANSTWTATLEEIWDDSRDGAGSGSVTRSFNSDLTPGTYTNQEYMLFSTGNNNDFLVTTDKKIIYKGALTITNAIVVSLSGTLTAYTGTDVTFELRQNGSVIKTLTVPTAPGSFTINLSPSGTVTIVPNDVFEVHYTPNVTTMTIGSSAGYFQVNNYTLPNSTDYDAYSEKYLYE